MSAALSYPSGLYRPEPIVDLSEPATRKRLSGAALKGFFKLIERWNVRDEDARQLLGGVSNGTYYALKKSRERVLDADVLTRISYLLGIFAALNALYSKKLADAWVQLPNTNPIFSGQTPLAYMLRGGLPAMQIVRRLLDARRA